MSSWASWTVIPYGRHSLTGTDIEAVVAALQRPYITQGPIVPEFEERIAHVTGARFGVVFSSGTAALHAAYFVAGVQRGRKVLTTPITFAATANAALYVGGGVQFADVDAETITLDPEAVRIADTSGVSVLAPVHFAGHVAHIEALAEVAAASGWRVVEDAAHALGASYFSRDGREYRVGACEHSDMCCFSFHPVKHVTTGEGGAVTTNDPDLARALRLFRTHGITREPTECSEYHGPWYYEQQLLGFNYRITDFQCALGMSQLDRLADFVAARQAIARYYDAAFDSDSEIRPLLQPRDSRSAYHLYVVRVDASRRRSVFEELRAASIGVNVHYIPVYRHPFYRATGFAGFSCPNAEAYYAEAITLPLFPDLSLRDVDRVIAELREQVSGG